MALYPQQQAALSAITAFLNDENSSVFILRGYAGTGKTTMIKSILPIIENMKKGAILMAPTGRAAKILSQKTGYEASTIHSSIYSFSTMEDVRYDENGELLTPDKDKGRSKGEDDIQFWFAIRRLDPGIDPSQLICIVDEASMISASHTAGESLHFGTDILINDLITHMDLGHGGKIIFVGDPAQLPPVGDNRSAALQDDFFIDLGWKVSSFSLTEVIRQSNESIVLKNAMMVRDLLDSTIRNTLCFERKENEVIDITPTEIKEKFFEELPSPNIGDAIIICYSNSLAKDYNDAVRQKYFPDAEGIVAGDILQIVKNNVDPVLEMELFNGDFARTLWASSQVEEISAPVWTNVDGKKSRIIVTISFRDVVLQTDKGEEIRCKIVDSLLNSRDRSLSGVENVALYINFRMRHPELKKKDKAFYDSLKADAYFNAVQAKYGYAITAHKSQGGEWSTVFVDYSGRTGLNDDCLRWIYTATTRAEKVLYGVNMPRISPLSKLVFNPIGKIARPAKEALSFAEASSDGFLPPTASLHQVWKYISAKENLLKSDFIISKIDTLQYVDRYTIDTPNGQTIIDCLYNGSYIYTSYRPLSSMPDNDKILSILADEHNIEYRYDYTPSDDLLEKLHARITSSCDSLSVKITNIVEHGPQYYVAYYLHTTGRFAQMIFYYNSSGFLTHCIASSDLGPDDTLLQELIDDLKK